MADENFTIRPLKTFSEMYAAVELQRVFWGNDAESVVPAQMLYTIYESGGHVLAAFDGSKMVGVLIGLIGTDIAIDDRPAMANLLIASKRMVVLPEYRSGGIGYKLKLAQREAALRQSIRLVTWTFDPLKSPNAHLNLRKLGGIIREYKVNAYGTDDRNGLSQFGWSDRIRVQWWVTHRRVEERINGTRPDLGLAHYLDANAPILNPSGMADGVAVPGDILNTVNGAFALVEIPLDYDRIAKAEPGIAQGWQHHIRTVMQPLFDRDYFISDFLRGTIEGRERAFYVFSADYGFDFSAN
ncbi:MAG: hypothetical protein MUC99_09960 [Anaerolineae bacterium]|nr:hypothetical protein [Anaerolineae bacterium]